MTVYAASAGRKSLQTKLRQLYYVTNGVRKASGLPLLTYEEWLETEYLNE